MSTWSGARLTLVSLIALCACEGTLSPAASGGGGGGRTSSGGGSGGRGGGGGSSNHGSGGGSSGVGWWTVDPTPIPAGTGVTDAGASADATDAGASGYGTDAGASTDGTDAGAATDGADAGTDLGDAGVAADASDSGVCGTTLSVRIRDFKDSHPDFEHYMGSFKGLVENQLGPDRLPVYAATGSTNVSTGKTEFDQWYRDVDGVNLDFRGSLFLVSSGDGRWVFDSAAFFPLDGLGFGNQGREHNFHFTTEIHTTFNYRGGEVFTFRGDDDVWVFVNHHLAVDLGGVHAAETGTIDFNAKAAELGISVGNQYSLDIFQAERHTSGSNFRIETTIDCFVDELG